MTDDWDERFPPLERIPAHIGIIMDGNGRWARKQGQPRTFGHRAGVENIRRVLAAAARFGVQYMTVYAFSTENWGRPQAEVQTLLSLLGQALKKEVQELHKNGAKLRHLGKLDRLPPILQEGVLDAVELTKNNTRITLNIAFDYGAKQEIVDAVKAIINNGTPIDQITPDTVSQHLYTAGQPDPDMIIRTAGEMRLSNFMLWQASYAEYYSTPTYWPDFNEEELYKALLTFNRRERRYGLLPGEISS
ncbi:MAG: di-trans,poly-cis-decaprenylcistransferase [Anaerolineae bacterium]|nr:di-trans,poly-cis-decaprenylcistransferase [Anaerolineae bacterium]